MVVENLKPRKGVAISEKGVGEVAKSGLREEYWSWNLKNLAILQKTYSSG